MRKAPADTGSGAFFRSSPSSKTGWDHLMVDTSRAEVRATMAEAKFEARRFRRADVARAIGIPARAWKDWQARGQILLDADRRAEPANWRSYSTHDVMRIALAVRLSKCGIDASMLMSAIDVVEDIFPLSRIDPVSLNGCIISIIVTPTGEIWGPVVGGYISLATHSLAAFAVVRLDILVRETLDRLNAVQPSGG